MWTMLSWNFSKSDNSRMGGKRNKITWGWIASRNSHSKQKVLTSCQPLLTKLYHPSAHNNTVAIDNQRTRLALPLDLTAA